MQPLRNRHNAALVAALMLWSSALNSGMAQSPDAGPISERISLDFKGINIVDLFRLLSVKTGTTIVPSKNVEGRISIYLNDTTFEDVLEMILVSQGLAAEKKGEVYYILTMDEYTARYGTPFVEKRVVRDKTFTYADADNLMAVLAELKSDVGKVIVDRTTATVIMIDTPEKIGIMEQMIALLDKPLKTKVYDINYGDPSVIKPQIEAAVTPAVGKVTVDERARKLVVTDLPARLAKIDSLMAALDAETQQVFLQTEIVQITYSEDHANGIEWQKVFNEKNFDGLSFQGNFPFSSEFSSYAQISVGTLSDSYEALIQFLKSYGEVKTVSRPQIAAINNQEAKILIGTREPIVSNTQTLSESGETTMASDEVEYEEIGVKLLITPTIGRDGFITVKVNPEISSILQIIETNAGSRYPVVETSTAETTVKVKDATTIMIGGLIRERDSDTVTGIPVLSDLPLVGGLFRNQVRSKEKSELVIFITPRIIRGDGSEAERGIVDSLPPELLSDESRERLIQQEIRRIGGGQPERTPALELIDRELKGLKEFEKYE